MAGLRPATSHDARTLQSGRIAGSTSGPWGRRLAQPMEQCCSWGRSHGTIRPTGLCVREGVKRVSDSPKQPVEIQVKVEWPNAWEEGPSFLSANEVLIQPDPLSPDTVLVTFGHVAPPSIIGTPDDLAQAVLARGSKVTVRPQARLSISAGRFVAIAEALSEVAKQLQRGSEES